VENPGYRVVNVTPGVILTTMHEKTIAAFDLNGWPQLPLDDSKCGAHIRQEVCLSLDS
jgi:hypothetical protein